MTGQKRETVDTSLILCWHPDTPEEDVRRRTKQLGLLLLTHAEPGLAGVVSVLSAPEWHTGWVPADVDWLGMAAQTALEHGDAIKRGPA